MRWHDTLAITYAETCPDKEAAYLLRELAKEFAVALSERDALARLFLHRPASRPGKVQLRSATLTEVLGEWDSEADAMAAAVKWAKRQQEGR